MKALLQHPFWGRRAVVVTKHGKERVLAPILRDRLNVHVELLLTNTDRYGTFTGEVERCGSQLDALWAKVEYGSEHTRYDSIFVASEGAFFPIRCCRSSP